MKNIEVPEEILDALYIIVSHISNNFNNYEVYDEAKPYMNNALDWLLKYGSEKNLDINGLNYRK